MKLLLVAHAAATFFMLGVICLVQVVHYPLFARVSPSAFGAYHHRHVQLITYVVMPPMLLELATALALALGEGPGAPWERWLGLALVGVVWMATALWQVPAHGALGDGFDPAVHRHLVTTNWVRTGGWLARSLLVGSWLLRV